MSKLLQVQKLKKLSVWEVNEVKGSFFGREVIEVSLGGKL